MTDTFFTLAVDSKTQKPLQYEHAWRVLLDSKASHDDRANAKCWLTYRTADGEIQFKDWEEKIAPVQPNTSMRWQISLLAAEAYVHVLHGPDERPMLACAERLNEFTDGRLRDNPGSVQSFIRVKAVEAYWMLCHRHESEAFDPAIPVSTAFSTWKTVMGSLDWQAHPFRWLEMRDDAQVLMALSHIAYRVRLLSNPIPKQHAFSAENVRRIAGKEHWIRCLSKIRTTAGYAF